MSKSNTQAEVAAEVAVANAETAVVESSNANVITGIIRAFNFVPAKDTKNNRAYNSVHIAVEGEDEEVVCYPYDSQLENAMSLNDAVAFLDVCDVRERRKNVLFRGATIEFGYDDENNVVINSITLARSSKAAALAGIN
ncbi:MAG: hypothetical protein IJZ77_02800 [Bacilli bacterium]|nr:hypothetical protein [Bacilli bacterium]